MRRKAKPKLKYNVERFFAFSWHKCTFCNEEFRFEFGWKVYDGVFYTATIATSCKDCHENPLDLDFNVQDREKTHRDKLMSRLNVPPPPPNIRTIRV